MPALRLIVDPPRDGPSNMALDEALLDAVGRADSPPTLRFYRWDPPTISLGYFQPYAEYEALPPPAGALAVVRRQTGGGAILHDQEITYSLTLPLGHPLLAAGATDLYRLAHAAVADALAALGVPARRRGQCAEGSARRGPFFCFARQHCDDLVLDDGKIAGSAQRRTRTAVLQHGSIILANRFPQHPCAPALRPAASNADPAVPMPCEQREADSAPPAGKIPDSPVIPHFPRQSAIRNPQSAIPPSFRNLPLTGDGRAAASGDEVASYVKGPPSDLPPSPAPSLTNQNARELCATLAAAFARALAAPLSPGLFSSHELSAADALRAKYAGHPWTRQR